jgi:hypothetical protein
LLEQIAKEEFAAEERLAVVAAPGGQEDTTAWGLAAGTGLFTSAALLAATQAAPGKTEEAGKPEYTVREQGFWENDAASSGPKLTPYQRKKTGEGESNEDPAPLMCSAAEPPAPEETQAAETEAPDDDEPRTAASLLRQANEVWGQRDAQPAGVLE